MQIHEIKTQLSIHQVLARYDLEVKNNHVHCPFHDDKTPSMRVYKDTNTVFCFSGNCRHGNKVMDCIDFIMYKENCSKHQAINKAKALLGFRDTQTISDTYYILKTQLPRSKKAREYLKLRGLEKLDEVGSNHRNGNNAVAYQYPKLKNCIIFALRDQYANVVSLYGRSFSATKQNGHFYLVGRTGLYPQYPKPDTQNLILTESVIDAATLQLHATLAKQHHILACYGTNGFTQEHKQCVSQLKQLRTITIFFDGDAAGQKAAHTLAQQLEIQFPEIEIKIVDTPQDEDINSLWTNHEDAAIFQSLLQEASPVSKKGNLPKQNTSTAAAIEPVQSVKPVQQEGATAEKETSKEENNDQQFLLQVKGNPKNTGDSLKVTLQTKSPSTGQMLIQKLDLFDYTSLEKHAKIAAKTLDIDSSVILKEWQIYALTLEKQIANTVEEKQYTPDAATKNHCITYLKSHDLIHNINQHIGKTGVVGEEQNRILLFLIAISYQSKNPLHGLIQGSSGSGKTKLLQSIYKLIPKEHYKALTRITESSLYNYKEKELCHTLMCLEDLDGLKEDALLALRELQSNGWVASSKPHKNDSGAHNSKENQVNGPIATLACTTKADVYEDNISRCFTIAVDESPAQTSKIIAYQNKVAKGDIDTQEQEKIKHFIQNCIRVLRPLSVVNPFADRISLPQDIHKLRRLHGMYQNLVAQITYLHQYQRKCDKQNRIIATKQDLQIACDILLETIILKVDELHGGLRQFFEALKKALKHKGKGHTFTRFDVRKITGLGTTQTRNYIQQLLALEYLQQFGYANRGYTYKISYWDEYSMLRTKIQKDLQYQIDQI